MESFGTSLCGSLRVDGKRVRGADAAGVIPWGWEVCAFRRAVTLRSAPTPKKTHKTQRQETLACTDPHPVQTTQRTTQPHDGSPSYLPTSYSDTVAQHGTCTHGWHMGSGTPGWAQYVSSQNVALARPSLRDVLGPGVLRPSLAHRYGGHEADAVDTFLFSATKEDSYERLHSWLRVRTSCWCISSSFSPPLSSCLRCHVCAPDCRADWYHDGNNAGGGFCRYALSIIIHTFSFGAGFLPQSTSCVRCRPLLRRQACLEGVQASRLRSTSLFLQQATSSSTLWLSIVRKHK